MSMPRLKHNYIVASRILIDAIIKEFDDPSEFRFVFFNNLYYRLNLLKYPFKYNKNYHNSDDEYQKTDYDIWKSVLVRLDLEPDTLINFCRLLAKDSPFTLDQSEINTIKEFLVVLYNELSQFGKYPANDSH